MDADDFERLEKLVKENNEILRGMRRSMRIGHVLTFFYWMIFLGVGVSAYYFVQPFITPLITTATAIFQNLGELQGGVSGGALAIPAIFGKIQGQ